MMQGMRTTVTLDPEAEQLIQQAMRNKGLSFKQAVNDAILAGSGARRSSRRIEFPAHDMGEPWLDLTKALRVSAELEDDELQRKLTQGR